MTTQPILEGARDADIYRLAAMMYDTLMNGDEIYDPILPQILIIYLTIVTQNYIFLYEIKLYNFADKYRFDIIYNSLLTKNRQRV